MTNIDTSKRNNRRCKLINIISLTIGVVACLALGTVIVHADALDNVVLLEKRNSGYWNLLLYQMEKTREYIPEVYANSENYIKARLGDLNSKGINIKFNPDSSITVTGNNERGSDLWYEYCFGGYFIDGDYYYDDGGVSNSDCFSYASGVNVDENYNEINRQNLLYAPQYREKITINNGKYNRYAFGICIKADAKDIDITFRPQLTLQPQDNYNALGYISNNRDKLLLKSLIHLNSNELKEISNDDLELFIRQLKKNSYGAVTIVIGDNNTSFDQTYYNKDFDRIRNINNTTSAPNHDGK